MSHAASETETDFTNDTDADLLTMASWQATDGEAARKAWGEFYLRHFNFLGAVCMRYKKSIGIQGVEDLVNETFIRVFTHGAETFATSEDDPVQIRKQVRKWLRVIAHRQFLMNLRGRDDLAEQLFAEVEVSSRAPISQSEETRVLCEKARAVVETLSDRELDVLFARFWNYDITAKKKQTFDPDVLADLQVRWETTDANIRKILSRTLTKIREGIS